MSRYVMMMQLEVADRICGKPSTKDYNALSLWIEYRALAKKIMKVPRTVFIPSPNVDSAVVRLDVYKDPPMYCENERALFFVIQGAFAQRRKTLENNLSLKYILYFIKIQGNSAKEIKMKNKKSRKGVEIKQEKFSLT